MLSEQAECWNVTYATSNSDIHAICEFIRKYIRIKKNTNVTCAISNSNIQEVYELIGECIRPNENGSLIAISFRNCYNFLRWKFFFLEESYNLGNQKFLWLSMIASLLFIKIWLWIFDLLGRAIVSAQSVRFVKICFLSITY